MSPGNAEMAGHVTFGFTVSGLPPDTFFVQDFTGEEALNGDFVFRVTLLSRNASLVPQALLGRDASFFIESRREGDLVKVPTHGMIGELGIYRQVFDRVEYRATLVPRLSRLDHSSYSEIYTLEKSIPELLEEVLKESGFTSQDYQFKVVDGGRPRSFVCQYRESPRHFIDRWAEREGLVYYFDHSGEREKVIFYDQPHQKPSWTKSLTYRPPGDLDAGFADDSLTELFETARPVPGKTVVSDFNYRKANLDIREEEVLDPRIETLVEEHGDNLRTNAEAKRQVKIRGEALRCRARIFTGTSTATEIRAGTTITVRNYFRDGLSGSLFVTRARYEGRMREIGSMTAGVGAGEGGIFTTSFEAIPFDVPFRPECKTPWPQIPGVVQGIVEGEGSGKFAELNEYGEYKIRFPFALTKRKAQKGSGWVRLSTPLAGAEHGIHFPLHKDTEVLVSFMGGDPDQPVIVGALHNSETRNLVTNKNPATNIIHTFGGTVVMIND